MIIDTAGRLGVDEELMKQARDIREEDEIRKAIRADDADFLLAERGGAVVGFALVGYAGWIQIISSHNRHCTLLCSCTEIQRYRTLVHRIISF